MVVTSGTDGWQRAYTSPVTCADPAAAIEIAPLETMSPTMFKVPPDVVVIALPGMPPHPAWLKAATVGVYRRLFTPADAAAESWGAAPLVRMRAN
jgi:hypothetical protein